MGASSVTQPTVEGLYSRFGKSILEVPDTGTWVLDNTRPFLHSSIVSFWITPACSKERKCHIFRQYWYTRNVPVFTNTGTFQYLGPEVYFSPRFYFFVFCFCFCFFVFLADYVFLYTNVTTKFYDHITAFIALLCVCIINMLAITFQMMLGLASHEPHFSLLREEVRFGKQANSKRPTTAEETTFHLLHLSLFREYLDAEFASVKVRSLCLTLFYSVLPLGIKKMNFVSFLATHLSFISGLLWHEQTKANCDLFVVTKCIVLSTKTSRGRKLPSTCNCSQYGVKGIWTSQPFWSCLIWIGC